MTKVKTAVCDALGRASHQVLSGIECEVRVQAWPHRNKTSDLGKEA